MKTMSRKKPRCEVCVYRNTHNFDVFKCNYVTVVGCTRGAVPPEKCTHFREGNVAKAPTNTVTAQKKKPKKRKRTPPGG